MADNNRREVLASVLAKLRQRIEQIRDRKETIGEQNTKAALIDPLLSALGWDLEEIDEVCREYKRKPKDNPVDYALFILRTPRLFVEAKGLEKDLNDRKWISQTLSYATVVGVEWCVLTNGDEYRLYNSHATVDVEEKLFRRVLITDASQREYTLNTLDLLSKEKMAENLLDVLWKAHFVDRNVKRALDGLWKNEDGGLIRLIRKKTAGLSPSEIRYSLKRAELRIEFPVLPAVAAPAGTVRPTSKPLATKKPKTQPKKSPVMLGVTVRDLIGAGLVAPPVDLERKYKGHLLKAAIQSGGSVRFDGKDYDSPSTAAGMARRSIIGSPSGRPFPQTNGWTFWQVREADTGRLHELDFLRKQYLNRR